MTSRLAAPLAFFGWTFLLAAAGAAPPSSTDDRLTVELIAEAPDIVTPTGVAVDVRGAVWVAENHTHQRPAGYQGPKTDRIRVFSDFGPDGKARKVRTFADGFRDSMSLAFGPDGECYFATRSALYRLRDSDKDGKADERVALVRLETKGDYPHNGLSGFAFDAHGWLYFGLGENLGESYKLVGADGSTLSGGGEGGSVYRCRPNGSELHRIATGFWNPYHQAIDAFGRLYIVDNDPDARGPCRLVHVVEGGDYGYRFRYGRKGQHPFVCWNGELPGTLPMAAGTAEAPSGVVAYESDGLPADYRGKLLVTSWGDHVVECFTLSPRGASVEAKGKVLLRGGEDFRPVGVAVAPDGSLVISDWVDKSYPVHGKGRLWRVRAKQPVSSGLTPEKLAGMERKQLRGLLAHPKVEVRRAAAALLARDESGRDLLAQALKGQDVRGRLEVLWALTRGNGNPARWGLHDPAPEVRAEALRLSGLLGIDLLKPFLQDKDASVQRAAILQAHSTDLFARVVPFLESDDPFLLSAAVTTLGRSENATALLPCAKDANPRRRLGALLALRAGGAVARSVLPSLLDDADPAVRRAAIQWVGEEGLKEHAEAMRAAAAKVPVSREVFTAWLAAESLLAGAKPNQDEVIEDTLLRVLQDGKRPAAVRAVALRMLRPDHPGLKSGTLRQFVAGRDAELRAEAIRSLALRADADAQTLLRDIASHGDNELSLRLIAVAGLGHSAASSAETRRVLLALRDEPALRRDALRSLRGAGTMDGVAAALAGWWAKQPESPTAERRELAAQLASVLVGVKGEAERLLPQLREAAGPRPATPAEWQKAVASGGDAAAGERLFFHARGPNCVTCHRVGGRGGVTGPDLSVIAATFDRERLAKAILYPSEEVQPRYVAWRVLTRSGRLLTGTIALEGHDSTLTLVDAEGKTTRLNRLDVEERTALPTSIMPDNLHTLMTPAEFRDLLAYLATRK